MNPVGSWDSEDLSTEGSLSLKGLYCNPCTPTYLLVDQFDLEGRKEVFTLNTLDRKSVV